MEHQHDSYEALSPAKRATDMRYVFGDCTLDLQRYLLDRAGQPIPLRPKVFQVLLYLLIHRDRVIAKLELYDQVWPGQFISDAALEGVIKAVRRAVGDDGRRQWCIQTRRGQGYCFVAPVQELAGEATETPAMAMFPDISAPPVQETGESTRMAERPDASRRQLTVLCGDLVDASQLASQLDPEDFRDVIQAYRAACTALIQHYEGATVQDSGTGFVAYFGYPVAQEDATSRAVRAGLEMVAALGTLNNRLADEKGMRLRLRVGIHTGVVVVAEHDPHERHPQLAFGHTPHVAAQIQALATPDTVVISATTARLVQGLFVCREVAMPLGQESVIPEPLVQVLGISDAQSRFEVVRQRGLRPLVGREQELELLLRLWEQSRQGYGQGLLLCGEAGIGKSRLLEALRQQVEHQTPNCKAFLCLASAQQSALHPVNVYLQQRFQWCHDEPPERQLAAIEQMLQACDMPLQEHLPLFAMLLSIPLDMSSARLPLSPEQQQRKLLESVITWLLREAERQPGLVIWEDIHWADPSTLALLSLFLDQVPRAPFFALCTYRPTFQPPWSARSYLTSLMLNGLNRDQVTQMVAYAMADRPLAPEVLQEVIVKSDGVPLYVEELLQMMLESEWVGEPGGQYIRSASPATAIPETLHDLLMARLDRLGAAREVAQLGAMLGREFSYELLRVVAPLEEAALQQRLEQLVAAEFLYQRGLPPQASYMFKHVLIQDAAYQSLLKSTRRQYHHRIASVLREQFPETCHTQPELLAYHYTQAGHALQAIPYWQHAGQCASERSAYMEAITHLTQGLALIGTLPDSAERFQYELSLRTTLGPVLMSLKGYGAPEVQDVYARARQLCYQIEDQPQYFPVLWGLYSFYLVRAEYPTAHELAQQCLLMAEHADDPALLLHAHLALGETLFWLGEVDTAHGHLTHSLRLYDAQQHRPHAFLYSNNPAVICQTYTALALWWRGDADQALAVMHGAVRLAQELAHPSSMAWSFVCLALLHSLRREIRAVQVQAEAVIALSAREGFPFWAAVGTILYGWAQVQQGRDGEGMLLMRQGLEAYEATGAELGRPYFLVLLADAYGQAGETEAGLQLLAEARLASERSGEQIAASEVYRLTGELLLRQSSPLPPAKQPDAEAEVYMQRAFDMAVQQGAQLWQLRAAMSLSRLWQQRGKEDQAASLLADVYNGVREGLDTADLQECQALLAALRSRCEQRRTGGVAEGVTAPGQGTETASCRARRLGAS
jgi:predicted ATPase/class 3 adenylate cyclase